MASKKLKLSELKVQSFVTNFEENEVDTIKGGGTLGLIPCPFTPDCTSGRTDGPGCKPPSDGIGNCEATNTPNCDIAVMG